MQTARAPGRPQRRSGSPTSAQRPHALRDAWSGERRRPDRRVVLAGPGPVRGRRRRPDAGRGFRGRAARRRPPGAGGARPHQWASRPRARPTACDVLPAARVATPRPSAAASPRARHRPQRRPSSSPSGRGARPPTRSRSRRTGVAPVTGRVFGPVAGSVGLATRNKRTRTFGAADTVRDGRFEPRSSCAHELLPLRLPAAPHRRPRPLLSSSRRVTAPRSRCPLLVSAALGGPPAAAASPPTPSRDAWSADPRPSYASRSSGRSAPAAAATSRTSCGARARPAPGSPGAS